MGRGHCLVAALQVGHRHGPRAGEHARYRPEYRIHCSPRPRVRKRAPRRSGFVLGRNRAGRFRSCISLRRAGVSRALAAWPAMRISSVVKDGDQVRHTLFKRPGSEGISNMNNHYHAATALRFPCGTRARSGADNAFRERTRIRYTQHAKRYEHPLLTTRTERK